jgi:A/G-specific adenine glycosylase
MRQASVKKSRKENGLIRARDLPTFQRALLSWFERNKRDLPWRHTRDPYRIWISEMMLQQTRVAAVVPYYERFMATFPTIKHLARARINSVLASWSGLGYYSRARNLHRAAKFMAAEHGARFPSDLQAALALPGVGNYTAAAILSIAYDQPYAVLDGNVARVIARVGVLPGNIHEPKTRQRLQSTATSLLATSVPGNWNQAIMELGATLCTPTSPVCDQCPIGQWCRAHQLHIPEKYPAPRNKPATVNMDIAAAVFRDQRGRTLLVKNQNGDGAPFSGLWQFPAAQIRPQSRSSFKNELLSAIQQKGIINVDGSSWNFEPLPMARHTVTFRKIRLHPFLIRVQKVPLLFLQSRTLSLHSIGQSVLPVSNATRKIAQAALERV